MLQTAFGWPRCGQPFDAACDPAVGDSYFHKVRSNLRFAARPAHIPSGNGRTWDRHYLYNPATMTKIVDIYRFSHICVGTESTKVTPAMKLGLAKGKIYPRDLFA